MPTRIQLINCLFVGFLFLVFGRSCYEDYAPSPTPVVPAADRLVAIFEHQSRSYSFKELAIGGLQVVVDNQEIPNQVLESGQVELTFPDGLVERFGYDAEGKISLIDFTPPPPPPPKPKPRSKPKPKPTEPPRPEDKATVLRREIDTAVQKLLLDADIRQGWSKRCGDWYFHEESGSPGDVCFKRARNSNSVEPTCYSRRHGLKGFDGEAEVPVLEVMQYAINQCGLGGVR
jgi:hypothetical protein